jgi:hypothetical protein
MRWLWLGVVGCALSVAVFAAGASLHGAGAGNALGQAASDAVTRRLAAARALLAPWHPPPPASLDELVAHLARAPRGGPSALAMVAVPGGHWRLVNRAGEGMTVADPGEFRRALPLLAPAHGAATRATPVLLSDEVATEHRHRLDEIADGIEPAVFVGGQVHALRRHAGAGDGDGAGGWWAELRPGLMLRLTDRETFLSAHRRLLAPLDGRAPTVAALVTRPGAATRDGKGPGVLDVPVEAMAAAMRTRAGGAVAMTGALRGDTLAIEPAGGGVLDVPLARLETEASRAGVDLLVFSVGSPRQVGDRNWLRFRLGVAGLEGPPPPDFATLVQRLLGRRDSVLVTAERRASSTHLWLRARPAWSAGGRIGDVLDGMAATVTGSLPVEAMRATFLPEQRHAEMALRLLPGLPALWQFGYLVLFSLGLVGLEPARHWWSTLWPSPVPRAGSILPGRLSGPLGVILRTARALAFWVVFLPLAGPIARLARRTAIGPVRRPPQPADDATPMTLAPSDVRRRP